MKIRGPLHSIDARGRMGVAFVLSIWRGLNYARVLAIPTNPQSSRQLSIRGFLTTLSRLWAALTDAQRTAWEEYADAQTRKNVFGQAVKASGINEYIALGVVAEDAGETAVSDPPVTDEPAYPAELEVNPGEVGGNISIEWSATDGDFIDIWITPQLGAGRKAYPTDFRHLHYEAIATLSYIVADLVPEGIYGVKARAIRNSGQVGPYGVFRVVASAAA